MTKNKGYELARAASKKSDFHRCHTGAVAIYGNKVLAMGWNSEKLSLLQARYNTKARGFDGHKYKSSIHAEMMVVNKIELDGIKTKAIVEMLAKLKSAKKALIVTAEADETIYKSARNIEGVKVATVNTLCVYDILNCDSFIVLKDAAKKIEEVYA